MLRKSNDVLHFKLKPSKLLKTITLLFYLIAFLLIVLSSIEWYFKVLLVLLLALEFIWRLQQNNIKNHLKAIEIRGEKLFLKRKNDVVYQEIIEVSIKQNRIFAEIELHLKDEVLTDFFYKDCFSSKAQFCLLMQHLRFNHL